MNLPEKFADCFELFHEEAMRLSGFSDFGDEGYKEGFQRALSAIDFDLKNVMTDRARQAIAGYNIGVLIARLYAVEGWKKHPEYTQQKINKPLIITGLIRTGSTALHKLLSVDPQFQSAPIWLLRTPMVRPAREQWETIPEYQKCYQDFEAFYQLSPKFYRIHPIHAMDVEECIHGTAITGVSLAFAYGNFYLPSYESWYLRQDQNAVYRQYTDLLKLIGLGDKRPWLLKTPVHLMNLDALFNNFPDANVVWTHRDPYLAMGSGMNASETVQEFLFDDLQMKKQALVETQRWHRAVCDAEMVRSEREERFIDIHHGEFLSDPITAVKSIYDKFGYTFNDELTALLHNWLDEQPREQKAKQAYKFDEYGLTDRDTFDQLFDNYYQRYMPNR